MDRRKTTKKKKETVSPEVQARREAYDWIQSLISALLICVLVFVFVVRIMDVNGSSMVPTLVNGDKVLVSGLFYEPDRGDIVVFKKDSYNDNKALVKRVIAVEGDVVNIDFDNGIVYVNGEAVEEDYIDVSTNTKLDFIPTAATSASAWWTSVLSSARCCSLFILSPASERWNDGRECI